MFRRKQDQPPPDSGAETTDGGSETSRPAHQGGLTREHVVWAYRLLLDREPENESVIGPKLAGSRDTRELRHHLMTSAEFQQKNPDYAHTNDHTLVIKELADGGPRLVVDLADHVIGLNIVRGRYEADEIAHVRAVVQPGETVVDVGAHIGFFTIQMASIVGPGGKVYAFEPFGPNADLLERSIAENRFGDRIELRRAAVGASSGTASLTFPVETLNTGGAYLLPQDEAPLTGNQVQPVPIVALDDVAIRRPVRFIKMDVEGAEPQVIRGAARILREDRPAILAELHPVQLARASGVTPDQFLRTLAEIGYRAHTMEHGRPGEVIERAPEDALVSVVLLPA